MADNLAASSPAPEAAVRRVAIIQSNYLPWKGYFDIIHDVDLFVFHDDLQFTKDDWRNRNRIKTHSGLRWLTIPVGRDENRLICEVKIPAGDWAKEHWRLLQHSYAHAPYFKTYAPFFEEIYCATRWTTLSELNQTLIRRVAHELLGLKTIFDDSRNYHLVAHKQERVLELLRKANAAQYVSGPAAKSYLDETRVAEAGIQLVWKDYSGYPQYPQLHPPFEHAVSIVDLFFNIGPHAAYAIWGWRAGGTRPPSFC
jgi:hypothetical protein